MARLPLRSSASAISPSISRSAGAGAGRNAGRRRTRPSVRAISLFVTGWSDATFNGPDITAAASAQRTIPIQSSR
jgi:hypothetical protein